MRAILSAHLIFCDLTILMMFDEQHKFWKVAYMQTNVAFHD
jgi:hypothetical protein